MVGDLIELNLSVLPYKMDYDVIIQSANSFSYSEDIYITWSELFISIPISSDSIKYILKGKSFIPQYGDQYISTKVFKLCLI